MVLKQEFSKSLNTEISIPPFTIHILREKVVCCFLGKGCHMKPQMRALTVVIFLLLLHFHFQHLGIRVTAE